MMDPPAPPDSRGGDSGFHGLPDTGEVDVDHRVPVLLAELVQGLAAVADPGVGDNDIQPAQLLDPATDRGVQGVEVADVDLRGDDPPTQSFHQVGGFGEVVRGGRRNLVGATDRFAHIDRDDVCALLRQPHRVATSLAPCRTCDEGDLAFDSTDHEAPRSSRSGAGTPDIQPYPIF